MCWEAGKVARDKLKKRIAIFQEGVIIRKKEIEQAKLAILKEEAELAKLTKEEKILKDIVEQLKGNIFFCYQSFFFFYSNKISMDTHIRERGMQHGNFLWVQLISVCSQTN